MLAEKRIRNFRILVAAALADGELHEEEEKVLVAAARDLGMKPDLAKAVIEDMVESGDHSYDLPEVEKERAYIFTMLVRVIAADGILHENELRLLKSLAPSFGFTEEEVEKIAAVAVADALEKLKLARKVP